MGIFSLRPPRFDELGPRRALANKMVLFLIAAMAFLAALAIAGSMGAAALTRHWEHGAGAMLTVQVPRATEPAAAGPGTRLDAVQAALRATAGVDSVTVLSDEQVDALLRPWLGADIKSLAIPVPAVIAVRVSQGAGDLADLATRLTASAPGTVVEDHLEWAGRLGAVARGIQLGSDLVLVIVMLVTVAAVVMAIRSGLAARRDTIHIISQLGATDAYIARRFANRAATLAAAGGLIGGLAALPVLSVLTALVVPLELEGGAPEPLSPEAFLLPPLPLALLPVVLPLAAAVIGYLTAQVTMRGWLRRLP